MTALRKLLLIATVLGGLTSAACSAEGDVDTGGDGDGGGIDVEGEVGETEE